MARVALALYWHQHQPYYPDDVAGENVMPWVRLHAVKDYYGMAALLEEEPAMHATINFVPSLLVQMAALVEGRLEDKPLVVARKDAASLDAADVAFMMDNFFLVDRELMIRPYSRYHELYQLRGAGRRAARQLKARDLRDLQVWANLVWFHPLTLQRDAELTELVAKGRHYTEDEKHRVLDKQLQVIGEVAPMHIRLAASGQVELTTTPFYHPIMPLLLDKRLAREAMPEVALPRTPQSYPEDVTTHLRRAVAYHTKTFGSPPRGMWPSEGSVCQALVSPIAKSGIRWIASDEEILAKSLSGRVGRDRNGHVRHPELLYRPWRLEDGDASLAIVFRDHALSDLIGFQYQRVEAAVAVDDFVAKLKAIGKATPGDELLVSVVLDGENCWEFYPNQGVDFLKALYSRLVAAGVEPHQTAQWNERCPKIALAQPMAQPFGPGREWHNGIGQCHPNDKKQADRVVRVFCCVHDDPPMGTIMRRGLLKS